MFKKAGALVAMAIVSMFGFGMSSASAETVCTPEVNVPPVVTGAVLCVEVNP